MRTTLDLIRELDDEAPKFSHVLLAIGFDTSTTFIRADDPNRLEIETTPWLPMQTGPPAAPGAKGEDGTYLADLPTIFEVLERLGLKMEPEKDNVDVYVIDHLEKPSEN